MFDVDNWDKLFKKIIFTDLRAVDFNLVLVCWYCDIYIEVDILLPPKR